MSYITMSDLGRRGRGRRGGGRRWRGGGYYPWYYDAPVYAEPLVVMDPVDPQDELEVEKAKEAAALLKEAAEKEKIKAIAAAVSAELATNKGLGQGGGIYIDVMGPGAREDEIDVVAKDTDVIDEFVSSQDALRFRQEAGTVDITPRAPGMAGFGMTYFDTSMGDDPPPAAPSAAAPAAAAGRNGRAGGRGGVGGMLRRCATAAAVSVAVGAAVGYMLGSSKKA